MYDDQQVKDSLETMRQRAVAIQIDQAKAARRPPPGMTRCLCCGWPIDQHTVQCEYCGETQVARSLPAPRQPAWTRLVTLVLCLLATASALAIVYLLLPTP